LSSGVGDTQLGPRATIGAVARALFIELHRGDGTNDWEAQEILAAAAPTVQAPPQYPAAATAT